MQCLRFAVPALGFDFHSEKQKPTIRSHKILPLMIQKIKLNEIKFIKSVKFTSEILNTISEVHNHVYNDHRLRFQQFLVQYLLQNKLPVQHRFK